MSAIIPDWFAAAMYDAFAADRRAKIAAMPRVRFICSRDWLYPHTWAVGFLWGKNLDAAEGELTYRHEFILAVDFRLWFRRR